MVISVSHLSKYYQVYQKEPGFLGSIKSLFLRKYEKVKAVDVFAGLNKKYTKPGALLRGIRIREHLTQIEMARKLKVTQSDISQMENGVRSIGRTIAKRIEKLFDVNYKVFLE